MPATKAANFGDYLERELHTRHWVVAPRLTPHLKDKGYTVALSSARYAELHRAWEVEMYGAPLQSIQDAAPEMLEALRRTVKLLEISSNHIGESFYSSPVVVAARATIAKAEGRTK